MTTRDTTVFAGNDALASATSVYRFNNVHKTILLLITLVLIVSNDSPSSLLSNDASTTTNDTSQGTRGANNNNIKTTYYDLNGSQHLPLRGTLNPLSAAALIHELQPEAAEAAAAMSPNNYNASTIDVHKFWAMFDTKGWSRRSSESDTACFREPGFWEKLQQKEQCDRNWFQGQHASKEDTRNFPEYRPVYRKDKVVPAVLGYSFEIFKYNCDLLEKQRGQSLNDCTDFHAIDLSMHAGTSIKELVADAGWNMCRNLEWVVCAAQGWLPGQNTPTIQFASSPQVQLEHFLFRHKGCFAGDCTTSYSLRDVFLAEVSTLSYLCQNREDLFHLDIGQDFQCDFDHDAVTSMASAAAASPGGIATPEMWKKPWKAEKKPSVESTVTEKVERTPRDTNEEPTKLTNVSSLPLRGPLSPTSAASIIEGKKVSSTSSFKIDQDKFWSMFDRKGWYRRDGFDSSDACFDDEGFWDRLLTVEQCDRNWYEGGFRPEDSRNFKEFRPVYAGHEPAIPIFAKDDEDMFAYTCHQMKTRKVDKSVPQCDHLSLIDSAFHSGTTILRLDHKAGWNMCRNLEWVVCSIRGLLSEQQGQRRVRFATNPKVALEDFFFRRTDCWSECEISYSWEDVFFAEITTMSYLCKNREDLFLADYGTDFVCDFDEDAVSRMANAANESKGGFAKSEMWNKPWDQEQGKNIIPENNKEAKPTVLNLPISGTLNPDIAKALIEELPPDHNTTMIDAHKFWAMFDNDGWTRRSGHDACFREDGFWEKLKSREMCNRNWYEGGFPPNDPRNFKQFRPTYVDNVAVPALLGAHDEDMLAYTCSVLKEKTGESIEQCEDRFRLIDAVYHADLTILRLDARVGWNMCRNLEWVVCAIRGLVPEQKGENKVRFATVTHLDLSQFLFRDEGCEPNCEVSYSSHDVYLAEVTMISYLCKNRDELFKLEIGQEFECIFDFDAIPKMAVAANKSPGGFADPEWWKKPGKIRKKSKNLL